MLLALATMWSCSTANRKCLETETEIEEIEGVKIVVAECVKWADEVTKTTD